MSAILSPDGLYRYALARSWSDAPPLTFVMLNPSTADAELDDPTIRRCIGFARREGLGGIRVVNLYALRATNPAALKSAADPVGPENDEHIVWALTSALGSDAPVVAAWGALAEDSRARAVFHLAGLEFPWQALGFTKGGRPRHPLYLRGDAPLVPWLGYSA